MNIEPAEKVANRAAALTIILVAILGWFFPGPVVAYLLGATVVAALSQPKEFLPIVVIYFPIFAIYLSFLALLECKKVIAYGKVSLESFKRHF